MAELGVTSSQEPLVCGFAECSASLLSLGMEARHRILSSIELQVQVPLDVFAEVGRDFGRSMDLKPNTLIVGLFNPDTALKKSVSKAIPTQSLMDFLPG